MNDRQRANQGKFIDPARTASGDIRASVALTHPETLWFNTGTLCNIECANCYIESSPKNDALLYLSSAEVKDYIAQLQDRQWGVREIAFTGGEPFMNPEIIEMLTASLEAGHEVLVLTNAMRPLMRPRVQAGLRSLLEEDGARLTLRVSLDHYSAAFHDLERGVGSFAEALKGMRWLKEVGATMTVAGRQRWGESEQEARAGYAALFAAEGFSIDATHPGELVLFPEMDLSVEVPEISVGCWEILGKSPDDVMCASSRMVVRRRGSTRAAVVACTLLPYDPQFELGATLEEAERPVALNHPHCAKFCVLGGASCSAP